MIKGSKNRRQPLQTRPSRIRRDPPPQVAPAAAPGRRFYWDPTTKETWVVVTGVIMFAIALFIITFGISDFTS